MCTDPRVPACWKSSRTSSSVAWNERFPTKSFVNIAATSCRAQDRVSLFPIRLRRVGHCAPNDQHAPTGSRIEPVEPGPTVLSTPSPVKAPGLKVCFRSRSAIAFSRSRFNRDHLDAPHRGFAAAAAASGVILGQVIELLQVRLEPEEEPGHFPPKRAGPRGHPRRLVDLFGEVHDPRLKPEGLVETVGDLAEVMMVHDRLLAWRVLVMYISADRRATLQESCAIATMHDALRRVPELVRHPAGAKRGAPLLVPARKLPSSSNRCSISRPVSGSGIAGGVRVYRPRSSALS